MSKPDIVDVDAVRHESQTPRHDNPAQRFARSLLGTAVLERAEAARVAVREQFQTRVTEAHTRLNVLEKRAQDMVSQVQTSVQATANAARDRVMEEKTEAVQKVEQLVAAVAKVDRSSLEAWLKQPAEVREDVLTAVGLASQKQVQTLHEEIAALRAEIAGQFEAQTEALGHIVGKSDVAESTEKKARAKKTPAAHA
jgi:Ser-tRNA(Ala) deacylase AlaX